MDNKFDWQDLAIAALDAEQPSWWVKFVDPRDREAFVSALAYAARLGKRYPGDREITLEDFTLEQVERLKQTALQRLAGVIRVVYLAGKRAAWEEPADGETPPDQG